MQDRESMDTLSQRMERLRDKGYTTEFKVENGMLCCSEPGSARFTPDQTAVAAHFRFEGESDPGDMTILYALEAGDQKGMLSDGFGTYANPEVSAFIKKITNFHEGSIY